MKPINQYIVLVDSHRKNGITCATKERLYQRQTYGRYQVAAKSRKEAKLLCQETIGFGSVHVTKYQDPNPKTILPYKTVKKVNYEYKDIKVNGKTTRMTIYTLTDPIHATNKKES